MRGWSKIDARSVSMIVRKDKMQGHGCLTCGTMNPLRATATTQASLVSASAEKKGKNRTCRPEMLMN